MIVQTITYSRNRVILTPVFLSHCFFCRQVSVKIVLFLIQLDSRIYLSFVVVLAVQSNGQNNPISTVLI